MRYILLGGPGAGKGTQSAFICKETSLPHISTGDIFREHIREKSELGKKLGEYISRGELVPDELTIQILNERLKKSDCANGFVLDGFPRTIPQAEMLDKNQNIDAVVNINVTDDTIVKRMAGRRTCAKCSSTYHIIHNKPEKDDVCDKCSGNLVQRDDDKEETVKNRLVTYHKQTKPLIDYYKEQGNLIDIDGEQELSNITADIFKALGLN